MEVCIPPSGRLCNRTQMAEELCKNQEYALRAKNRYSRRLHAVNGRKLPVDHLFWKEIATTVATMGDSVSHQLVRVVLKTLGYSR